MIEKKFFIYVAVGIASAAIDIGLMQFIILIGIHYLIATTFGFIVGLVANFLLHARITFGVRYSHIALARYIAVVLANYVLTLLTVEFFHNWIGVPILGKILSLPLISVTGFLLSKYWIYKPVVVKKT